MSEFAGNLPRKFISFRHLGFESSAHGFPEGRESENPQTIEEVVGTSTDGVGETSNSPEKVMSVLETVPVASEVERSERVEKGRELTIAEKDCVMTSSEEEMDDLNAFVNEKLQFMSEQCLEQLVGDESVNVEEVLSGNLAAVRSQIVESGETVGPDVDQGRVASVCPGLTIGADVERSRCEVVSRGDNELDRILRDELGGSHVTSTLVKGLWPIYSKRRSSVLGEHGVPVCKSTRFGATETMESIEGGNLSRSGVTEASGGMGGSEFTSGGFSTLEVIAKIRADEQDRGLFGLSSGDGMVRVPQVESIDGEGRVGAERSRYYPSQSAKSLLKDFFELNPPTHLDPSHQTTSFSADQMIQFARAVGLEVSLASYGMLEDMLLKARVGGGVQPVGSRHSIGRSPFPSVAGSSWGDSIASRTNYSLPTVTETDVSNVVCGGELLEEPCSSRQADARLAAEQVGGEKAGSDSSKTLHEIKRDEKRKKKKSKMWKWSREGRQNPLLPAGNDKGGYVFTEEMLELAPFAKVFATGPDDPLSNRYSFYCMLCKRNISMRTRGLYELKRHFQRDCHFRADQRLREKICPGKVRGRDGRVLYGSKLEAEREVYMELDLPELSHKRPFYYDVLEGKPFTFTSEEDRIRIQINLLTIFLKSGGELWALEDYWTQVGVATGHSASIADFNWSPAHVSVSNLDLLWDFVVIVIFCRLVNLWALGLVFAHNFLLVGQKADVVPLL